jgi:hypothetical protein
MDPTLMTNLVVMVNPIGTVATRKGLKSRASLDQGQDETAVKITNHEPALIRLNRSDFQRAWNDPILPLQAANPHHLPVRHPEPPGAGYTRLFVHWKAHV